MIDEYRRSVLAIAEAIASPYHPGAEPGSAAQALPTAKALQAEGTDAGE